MSDIEEFYRKLQVTFILYNFMKERNCRMRNWSWRKANRIDPERNYSGNPLSSGRRFRLIVILEESETFIQINIVQLSNMFFKLFRILISNWATKFSSELKFFPNFRDALFFNTFAIEYVASCSKKKKMQKFNLKNIKFFAESLFDFHLSNDEIFVRIKFRSKLGAK